MTNGYAEADYRTAAGRAKYRAAAVKASIRHGAQFLLQYPPRCVRLFGFVCEKEGAEILPDMVLFAALPKNAYLLSVSAAAGAVFAHRQQAQYVRPEYCVLVGKRQVRYNNQGESLSWEPKSHLDSELQCAATNRG